MKKKILRIILVLPVLMGACGKKNPDGSTISGQLQDAPESMVYFEHLSDSGEVYLDSVVTDQEGNFVLENKAEALDYYLLRVDATNAVFMVLRGGENVVINGQAKDLENTYTISGSKDSELIRQMKKYDKYVSDSLFYFFKSAAADNPVRRDSMIRMSQEIYARRMSDYSRRFIQENPTSLVSLSVTRFLDTKSGKDLALMDSLNSGLLKLYPGNPYVMKFAEGLEEIKFLPPGSQAPEITLADTSGSKRSLSSLRGKVVLVDFWASWCGPCRKENPKVVEIYRKYKSRGFEIFAVSLDDEKSKWTQAIRTDGLNWIHVSELKEWETGVVKDYRVSAIPFTVLLDRKGRVIDKGLRGEELEEILNAVL